jgi:lysophospholipase L1-like esterase
MSAAESPHRYRSFVALGDSFTEGLQDDLGPAGRHRGWADRVAAALAVTGDAGVGVRYANLAVRGRLLDDVVREQVPVAEALAPDLVSFQAGGNDVLRPRVDLPGVLDRYERAVEKLRAGGAEVLLFTFVGRTGGSGRTASVLSGRFTGFNAHVRQVAERHGCPLADLGSAAAALGDRRLWHTDRIHQAPEGHARVAGAVVGAPADRATCGSGGRRALGPAALRPLGVAPAPRREQRRRPLAQARGAGRGAAAGPVSPVTIRSVPLQAEPPGADERQSGYSAGHDRAAF